MTPDELAQAGSFNPTSIQPYSHLAFMIILDLVEKTGVSIADVIGWLRSGQPESTELPSVVLRSLSSASDQ